MLTLSARSENRIDQVAMLLLQAFMEQSAAEIDLKKEPHVGDALKTLESLMRTRGLDPRSIPCPRPISEKLSADR